MLHHIIYFLAIGAIVGICGGSILKRSRSGRLGNMIIGIVGALIGRYAYSHLEEALQIDFIVGPYLVAAICSMIALWVMDIVRGRRNK